MAKPTAKPESRPAAGGHGNGIGAHDMKKKRPVNGKPAAAQPTAPNEMRIIAEELALKQREISVSEFFTKNRHLLGFDNPTRALLTAVKEAVDNSLDACEEAGILPDVIVRIDQKSEDRFHVSVEDNGPGIVKEQIPKIFGKLLYGSKFHQMKMARGQQGIGISAVCLYSQLTTGKPMKITSRIAPAKPAHYYEILIDTNRNEPIVAKDETPEWKKDHGTRVEFEIEGRYIKGEKSIDEYLKQTVLANPHVRLVYQPPGDEPRIVYDRVSKVLPPAPRAIKPHPYGVELGQLIRILQASNSRTVIACLKNEFSRVSDRIAEEICRNAGIDGARKKPAELTPQEYEALFRGIAKTKIMAPPTDCIVPIGEEQILKALKANVQAEFYVVKTRPPAVYRGNPFQIEVGIAYGIQNYPPDEPALLHRYANRVPLLYQPGACAITKAVTSVDWKNYAVTQPRDAMPIAPMLVMVHMASVWVPFTSEAKEAIAHYDEIIKEIKLGLQECGRNLATFVRRKQRLAYEANRRSIFERYIEEVATSLDELTRCGREKVKKQLLDISRTVTRAMETDDKGQEQEPPRPEGNATVYVAEPEENSQDSRRAKRDPGK